MKSTASQFIGQKAPPPHVAEQVKTSLTEPGRPAFQLELRGVRIEEGTDAGARSDFLMELMEINEALDLARTSAEADKIGQDTKGKHVSAAPIDLKSD